MKSACLSRERRNEGRKEGDYEVYERVNEGHRMYGKYIDFGAHL